MDLRLKDRLTMDGAWQLFIQILTTPTRQAERMGLWQFMAMVK